LPTNGFKYFCAFYSRPKDEKGSKKTKKTRRGLSAFGGRKGGVTPQSTRALIYSISPRARALALKAPPLGHKK
jgi:hypothetical protein